MKQRHPPAMPPQAVAAPGPRVVDLGELAANAGRHLGHSAWREIPQAAVEGFAEATGDRQWIHVDPERARTGPFGAPVAHGFLTLALATSFLDQLLYVRDAAVVLNYGLNRVRFPAPLRAGVRVRMGAELASVEEIPGGAQAELGLVFEAEGETKPCCVATLLFRYYETFPGVSAPARRRGSMSSTAACDAKDDRKEA